MTAAWGSLRVRLAVVGFFAIYLPVLLLAGVTAVTDTEIEERDDAASVEDGGTGRSPWATVTVVALAPAAAGLAWWWAGRATRPIDRMRSVAEDVTGTDLGRRIALDRGPSEVVALAASFDAMLDRLEDAAEAQRRLVEETSHELRTPLSVLVTNADVLLAHPAPGLEAYRDGIERSRVAALRMRRTIDDLLVDARGRARTLDRRPADLAEIAARVVDEARVVAGQQGVEVEVTGAATAVCPVDAPTVARAVANLVDNAVRHAPAGTAVTVEVVAADGEAGVDVSDHGPGVPPDEQERIFERFWRGDATPSGTGLGLPIARHIAVAHGGRLTVRSPGPSGDGATFSFRVRR